MKRKPNKPECTCPLCSSKPSQPSEAAQRPSEWASGGIGSFGSLDFQFTDEIFKWRQSILDNVFRPEFYENQEKVWSDALKEYLLSEIKVAESHGLILYGTTASQNWFWVMHPDWWREIKDNLRDVDGKPSWSHQKPDQDYYLMGYGIIIDTSKDMPQLIKFNFASGMISSPSYVTDE